MIDVLILLALALAPGVAIGFYIYLNDKHEREPVGLLMLSFFFGILSVFITLLISGAIGNFITIDEQSVSQQAVHAFLIVALVEEFSKFIFVRGILYNNPNFNEPFDGIVYSVMVSMGFATFENILYVTEGGIGTAFMRMFTAVPAHLLSSWAFIWARQSLSTGNRIMHCTHWVWPPFFMVPMIIFSSFHLCPALLLAL
jgi:protease PrsW